MTTEKCRIPYLNIILPALFLIIAGCGGGSSSTPSGGLTSANAAAAAGAVVTSGNLLIEPSYLGAASINSSAAGRSFLMSLLDNSIGAARNSGRLAIAGTKDTTTNCTGGGTRKEASQWTDSDADPQNYTGTITYTNCKEAAETWNGTVQVTYEGLKSAPTRITDVVSVTYANITANTSLTLSGTTIAYSDFAYTNNELTSGAVALTGSISGTVNSKAINAAYDGFKMAYAYNGNTTSIQLTGKINPACANTSLTVATAATLALPTGASCYTGGELRLTDSSNNTVSAGFNADLSVSVLNNGAAAASYSSCSQIQGLCGS